MYSYYNEFVKLVHVFVIAQPRIGYECESRYAGIKSYRLLANCKLNLQTRKFANIQFATGTISQSFHHVYYSRIINIHICVYW